LASKVISTAKSFLGVPYVWGGTSPQGFDCSGFIQYVFVKNGVSLPRVASDQYKAGTGVSKSNLKPGDLVFFETYKSGASHVGIYLGANQFIHASSGAGKVTISDLTSSYYTSHYYGARRVI
jgi:cell wall-associated NlpC family hydrolase